jgi:hypothetical protein
LSLFFSVFFLYLAKCYWLAVGSFALVISNIFFASDLVLSHGQ